MNLWKTMSKLLEPPHSGPNLVLHGVYSWHCCLKMSVLEMVWTPLCPPRSTFPSDFIYLDSSIGYSCVLVAALWQLLTVPFLCAFLRHRNSAQYWVPPLHIMDIQEHSSHNHNDASTQPAKIPSPVSSPTKLDLSIEQDEEIWTNGQSCSFGPRSVSYCSCSSPGSMPLSLYSAEQ